MIGLSAAALSLKSSEMMKKFMVVRWNIGGSPLALKISTFVNVDVHFWKRTHFCINEPTCYKITFSYDGRERLL